MKLHAARTLRSLALFVALAASARAEQVDIEVPANSVAFGTSVTVLPNGNIVVTDPDAGPLVRNGAVHVYAADGRRISTLSGARANDAIGSGGVFVLADGNFVVSSPAWSSANAQGVGAVTWVDATGGLSGTVSAQNSLVGAQQGDHVGGASVTPLPDGSYVVASPDWDNGDIVDAGAATWVSGGSAASTTVLSTNSLVGSHPHDAISKPFSAQPSVIVLANGDYVVASAVWNDGAALAAGAVTRRKAGAPYPEVVSSANSIIGAAGDCIGSDGVVALPSGAFVIVSTRWYHGDEIGAGAVTWVPADGSLKGLVTAQNSLTGTHGGETVGYRGVTVLANGNYVVASPSWYNGSTPGAGAVTWCRGDIGCRGPVTPDNSLVGHQSDLGEADMIGLDVTALPNGNYVVVSPHASHGGAVTFSRGDVGVRGLVSPANSLVGALDADDKVGSEGVTVLANGNYVVSSSNWSNGSVARVGAVTWGSATTGVSGEVSPANSITGVVEDDYVGANGVTALANGHYVIGSPYWSNGPRRKVGAVTWVDGTHAQSGTVTAANSMIGAQDNDWVGGGGDFGQLPATALSNGDYIVASPAWANGSAAAAGAITPLNGSGPAHGVVSAANSLVGARVNEYVGLRISPTAGGVVALPGAHYIVASPYFSGVAPSGGAITLACDADLRFGAIEGADTVVGTTAGGGDTLVFAYDASHVQLVVGRPADNRVTRLRIDGDAAPGMHSVHALPPLPVRPW